MFVCSSYWHAIEPELQAPGLETKWEDWILQQALAIPATQYFGTHAEVERMLLTEEANDVFVEA